MEKNEVIIDEGCHAAIICVFYDALTGFLGKERGEDSALPGRR